MKRWLVALLVLLAVIVLVSPAIIGRLAERNLEENLSWAEDEARDIVVTTESFDRGWFTSEGRYRVELRDRTLRDLVGDGVDHDAPPPALIIDTRLDHGILPITSLAREHGTLQPGLASTVSTFQIDAGDGHLVSLPGKLYSTVGFGGETSSRYLLEPGTFEEQDVRAEWQGADISFLTHAGDRSIEVDGEIESFDLVLGGDTIRSQGVRITAAQEDVGYAFQVGSVELELDGVSLGGGGAEVSGFSAMTLAADSRLVDSRVDAQTKLALSGLEVPAVGDVDFVMDMAVERLDAEALHALAGAIDEAEQMDPATDFDSLYPEIERELQGLLSAGAAVRVDRLDITLPQGRVETKIEIEVPELDAAGFNWGSMMLRLDARAEMRIDAALYDFIQLMNPQAGALADMNVFVPDGDAYVMQAEYAQGLLNVNGTPMALPMPR